MAKENINENVNEIANDTTKAKENVNAAAIEKNNVIEFDAFASMREREQDLDYQREDDSVIFTVPLSVQRIAGGKSENDERIYYNYAVGYKAKINGKEIPQTVQLVPTEKRADIYDLLDAIFGEADRVSLRIVRSERTQTVNGVTRTSYTYSPCVLAMDEDGAEYRCPLSPAGAGGRAKFNNLVNKYKSMGILK